MKDSYNEKIKALLSEHENMFKIGIENMLIYGVTCSRGWKENGDIKMKVSATLEPLLKEINI